eukprot:3107719-Prymnesium_polylepis.1
MMGVPVRGGSRRQGRRRGATRDDAEQLVRILNQPAALTPPGGWGALLHLEADEVRIRRRPSQREGELAARFVEDTLCGRQDDTQPDLHCSRKFRKGVVGARGDDHFGVRCRARDED